MNEKKARGLLAAAMSTAMFVSSTAGAVPVLANDAAGSQVQSDSTPELVPQPQSVAYAGGTLEVSGSVNVEGSDQADADAVADLKDFLSENGIQVNETSVEGDTTFVLGESDDEIAALDSAKEALGMSGADSLGEEGYVLKVDAASDTVVIEGKDGDGTFYGVQTLRQLDTAEDGMQLAEAEVSDEPTMATRGTIEGFYGNPWTHEDRLSQIEFYGDYKMNTYIYAPKDDPYHREQWREPYPQSEMDRMQELIDTANENKVDFVFAISPGIDINFDGDNGEADFQALINKCQSLYDMGVRSFAILFDDISNKDGVKQAELLNRFNKEFVKAKGDVKPLITVPTEYDTHAMGTIDELTKDIMNQGALKPHQVTAAKHALDQQKYEKKEVVKVQDHVFKKGDHVKLDKMNREGDVLEVKKHELLVDLGGLQARVKDTDVTFMHGASKPQKVKKAGTRQHMKKTGHYEVNVIGMRYEEAMNIVEKFLDDALLLGYPSVRIVHGMGKGILRNGIRKKLDHLSYVKEYRDGGPNEGGLGVTVVSFE